jgi:hypothetical protein
MAEFVENTFDILYYYLVDQDIASETGPVDASHYADTGITTTLELTTAGWFPAVSGGEGFDELYGSLTSLPRLKITAAEPESAVSRKKAEVVITAKNPGYNSVEQIKYVPVTINPLYTNALAARGKITFTGGTGTSTYIAGDVVANNQAAGGGLIGDTNGDGYIDEGESDGIEADGAVHVNIYGNVYTAGDLHLMSPGTGITVKDYSEVPSGLTSDFAATLKRVLYGNSYLFDLAAAGNSVQQGYVTYYDEDNPDGIVPYFYRDSDGGNVYCNNLAVESGVTNASLSVFGNLWTKDDIQNDGRGGAVIDVDENYIGMTSTANQSGTGSGDPNGSSSVVNNAYLYGGTVRIGQSYVIPGTMFYKFPGGRGTLGSGTAYYQTAESAGVQAGEYFQVYIANSGDYSTYFINGQEYYDLYEHEPGSTNYLGDKIERFIDAIYGLNNLGSGVDVDKGSS